MRSTLIAFPLTVAIIAWTTPTWAEETASEEPLPSTEILAVQPESQVLGGPAMWASIEYLNWWIRPGPLRAPLVTAGNPLDPVPGALGQNGTQILFGDEFGYGDGDGFRVMAGLWLDDGSVGVEAGGFYLWNRDGDGFSGTTGVPGSVGLYIPAFRPDLGREGAVSFFDPISGFAGNLNVTTESRLYGVEVNVLTNWARSEWATVDGICGLRYLDLEERLTEFGLSSDLVLLNDLTFFDEFKTRNQFYGAQFGAQGTLRAGWLFANIRGTVAIGANNQTIERNGASQLAGTATGSFVGGFFTQPSNVGETSRLDYSIVPQGSVKVGFQCFGCATVVAGYDCLIWYRTVRPGDQIDRRVDTPIPLGGVASPLPTPTALFERSDFWAHGFSVGLDLRY